MRFPRPSPEQTREARDWLSAVLLTICVVALAGAGVAAVGVVGWAACAGSAYVRGDGNGAAVAEPWGWCLERPGEILLGARWGVPAVALCGWGVWLAWALVVPVAPGPRRRAP